jgi:hypothetical protein
MPQHLKQLTKPSSSSLLTSPTVPVNSFPPLQLPFPTEILSTLRALDLSHETFSKLSGTLSDAVCELQRRYSFTYEQICSGLVTVHHPGFPPLSEQIKKVGAMLQSVYVKRHLARIRIQFLAATEVQDATSPRQVRRSAVTRIMGQPFNSVSSIYDTFCLV